MQNKHKYYTKSIKKLEINEVGNILEGQKLFFQFIIKKSDGLICEEYYFLSEGA